MASSFDNKIKIWYVSTDLSDGWGKRKGENVVDGGRWW